MIRFAARLTRTVTRIVRDVAEAPAVAKELHKLRTTTPAPARRVVEVDIDPAHTPAPAEIEAAAREFEQARTAANAAARLRRRAEKVLRRTPSGAYGDVKIERIESARQVIDADAVKTLFAAHNLGPVPMKQCGPSIVVAFAEQATTADTAAPVLAAA